MQFCFISNTSFSVRHNFSQLPSCFFPFHLDYLYSTLSFPLFLLPLPLLTIYLCHGICRIIPLLPLPRLHSRLVLTFTRSPGSLFILHSLCSHTGHLTLWSKSNTESINRLKEGCKSHTCWICAIRVYLFQRRDKEIVTALN